MMVTGHRELEREASRTADFLDAALRFYGKATTRPVDGRVAAMGAWRAKVAADPSIRPESILDAIVAEAVATDDAAREARRKFDAEQARALEELRARSQARR